MIPQHREDAVAGGKRAQRLHAHLDAGIVIDQVARQENEIDDPARQLLQEGNRFVSPLIEMQVRKVQHLQRPRKIALQRHGAALDLESAGFPKQGVET